MGRGPEGVVAQGKVSFVNGVRNIRNQCQDISSAPHKLITKRIPLRTVFLKLFMDFSPFHERLFKEFFATIVISE